MVLDAIDTTSGAEQSAAPTKPFDLVDALSPLSAATEMRGHETFNVSSSPKGTAPNKSPTSSEQQELESRDAAVAVPCDSIRSYANELTASASLTNSRSSGRRGGSLAALVPAVPDTPAVVEEEERDAPPADEEPAAADEPEGEVSMTRSQGSSSPPRVTLITVTESDECKMDMDCSKDDDMAVKEMTRSRTDESHESVEIVVEPDQVEAEAETQPEEAKLEPEADPEESEAAKDEPTEPAEAEAAPASEAKEEVAAVVEESQVKLESNEAGKKKRFGMRKLSKPSKLPKKPTSPRGSMGKGMRPRLFGKKTKKTDSSNAVAPQEELASKQEVKQEGAEVPEEMALDQPVKQDSAQEEEAAAEEPAAEESVATAEEGGEEPKGEEPKEEEMDVVDLNEESAEKELAEAQEPPSTPPVSPLVDANNSIPPVQTKQSCSAFFVQQNSPGAVNKEIQRNFEEEEQEDEGLGEVEVKPQVMEVVTKKPTVEEEEKGADVEPKEDGVLDAESPNIQEEEGKTDIIEMLYAKAESCFGDVTNMCGPKQKGLKGKFAMKKKKSGGDASTTGSSTEMEDLAKSDESASATGAEQLKSDKSAEAGTSLVPSTSAEKAAESDAAEAAKDAEKDDKADAAAYTPKVLETIDGSLEPPKNPVQDMLSPLSVATEQASLSASSFIETIKENESFKSIVESLSQGMEAATDALFPRQSEEEKAETEKAAVPDKAAQSQQEKLDKAAEMAKKALDSDASPDTDGEQPQQQEEKGQKSSHKKPPSGKRFGFRRSAKKESKPQLKISEPKNVVDTTPTSSDKPKSPTSPSLGLLKRGFSTKAKKSAKSSGKSADEKKKGQSRFSLFKKSAATPPKKSTKKEESLTTPKSKAAGEEALENQDVQSDLASQASMNSQGLDEPQPSIEEKQGESAPAGEEAKAESEEVKAEHPTLEEAKAGDAAGDATEGARGDEASVESKKSEEVVVDTPVE
mmetsp:Transcript_56615/g.120210  ORF Transcript_56615/g.120210 Transcript_56615/m.120210 type:complete len:973 (-) Transcript_56615:289-3207(-)